MQTDLHEFLSRLAGVVALSLVPVALTAFLTMPSTFHHHVANQPIDPNAPVAHMTWSGGVFGWAPHRVANITLVGFQFKEEAVLARLWPRR